LLWPQGVGDRVVTAGRPRRGRRSRSSSLNVAT
jgi:hypothetical protein